MFHLVRFKVEKIKTLSSNFHQIKKKIPYNQSCVPLNVYCSYWLAITYYKKLQKKILEFSLFLEKKDRHKNSTYIPFPTQSANVIGFVSLRNQKS